MKQIQIRTIVQLIESKQRVEKSKKNGSVLHDLVDKRTFKAGKKHGETEEKETFKTAEE